MENKGILKIVNRRFDINYEKIKTVEDIKYILMGLELNINIINDFIPDNLKELFDNDLLIERVDGEK